MPKEALKSASARLKGSTVSKWAESAPSRTRDSTVASTGSESSFVYPGNDLAANIEKADGFYDSTWRPLNAGEDVATVKEDRMSKGRSSNAIPISSNHKRTSSWITMASDGHPAQAATNVSAYTPTPSYHSPSPSSMSIPLPPQDTVADALLPALSAEPEDPWAAWTSGNTTVTGEDAYLVRKSISESKSPLLPPSSPVSTKVDSQSSIHATGGAAVRGTSGRGRGRGRADLLSIKGSSANRAKSPIQSLSENPPSPADNIPQPSSSSSTSSAAKAATITTEDEDPWAAWAPTSNAVTGEAARKAREIATKAGKAIVEKNIVKPLCMPAQRQAEPPIPVSKNGEHSKSTFEDGPVCMTASYEAKEQVVKSKVASGWTTINTDAPPPKRASSPIQSPQTSETPQMDAIQGMIRVQESCAQALISFNQFTISFRNSR